MGGIGLFRLASVVVLLPAILGGCASLGGSQQPVMTTLASEGLLRNYPLDEVLAKFMEETDHTRRQAYRDFVVTLYLNAVERNYQDFRSRLSDERRELSLGTDMVSMGFTTYASVAARSITRPLAAAASAFSGAGGLINRDLYFDRALPGLLAAMDAEHLRRKAVILAGLHRDDTQYPLFQAFADLGDLELAGSLDRAIEEIVASANEQRQQAQAELATPVHVCEVESDEAVDLVDRIDRWVDGLAGSAANTRTLQEVGRLVGISSEMLIANPPAQIATLIGRRLVAGVNGLCTAADYRALIDRIKTETGEDVPA